jgi:hypothetical protein
MEFKINKKNVLFLLLLVAVPNFMLSQENYKKSDLKILIVAHNPDSIFKGGYGSPVSPRFSELTRTRGGEYKTLLDKYFKIVKIVNSESYNYVMSNSYDVTIMDDLPLPIESIDLGKYRRGESIIRDEKPMMFERYLPENFDRAIIMTGVITDDMTYVMPSKFVTQCHCLYAHAFNIKKEHDIFNKPYKVDLSYEKRETPSGLKKYYSGAHLPDEMDMWRVQTESPQDEKGYMIGQILVGMGFDDSPDCEFISGGESLKDITGMSMGRSGNFFHWGFSASPNFMTETAKQVFVNTVFYMAQFNGKKPIVKLAKNEGRNWVDEFCYKKTHQLIDHENRTYPKPINAQDTLVKFYTENYDYTTIQQWTVVVDEDAKSLGIPNNDVKLLEKSVEILESGKDKEKAFRLLKRYTEYDFNSPEKWRKWLGKYKKYLFFTELGGYKFMVDTWNHPELEDSLENFVVDAVKTEINEGSDKESDKMSFNVELKHNEGNNYTLELVVNINEGWHIYAELTPETNFFIPTALEFVLPLGVKTVGELITPKTYSYENMKGVKFYKGKSIFKQKLMVSNAALKNGEIKAIINYQLCNEYSCKMPNTMEQIVKL